MGKALFLILASHPINWWNLLAMTVIERKIF
jgi:hypothetical protein